MTNLIKKIADYADAHGMFPDSGTIMVCVSGGADSMCLLDALLEISNKRGLGINAVHYNHMLRGVESDRDEAFVKERCSVLGISNPERAACLRGPASARRLL